MRDPLTWSLPICRLFGITVRIHLLFLFLALGEIFRGMKHDYAAEAAIMQLLLFVSVLLHEFGHCFAARQVDGDANEILMWPLGGLAYVDVPNTPRAHFITVAGGPAVNVVLFLAAGGALVVSQLVPPIDLISWNPYHPALDNWATGERVVAGGVTALMARLFWVNWILFWFNMLLVGFPLDGGRMLQCILWPRIGFHRATKVAIFCGYIVALILTLYALVTIEAEGINAHNNLLLFFLALFMYTTCRQHHVMLESGALGEDTVLGYDFSQGYTSLERDAGQPRRRQSWWRRWLQRRALRKRQQQEERRQAEERRLDELLAKVQNLGTHSLTDEERRFLTRVSAKYRNRNRS